MKTWSKSDIQYQIAHDDRWLMRGILAIYKHQTEEERSAQDTVESNGVGFNGADAAFLSGVAEQWTTRKFISNKQRELARAKMYKYCGQLARIANGAT